MRSALLALSIVVFAASAGCRSSPPPGAGSAAQTWTPADPALMKPVDDMVIESQSIGAIRRLNLDTHEVHVNPTAWATWDASDKQTFTATLALYCDQRGSTHGRYVDIIDDLTGRRLARYDDNGYTLF
jgi:hypothetical protein